MPKQIDDNVFDQALNVGRPPNVMSLFPNSKALIVSGKYIDLAMLNKGNAICMAANGRSYFIIKGALLAAQRANACMIIEIAKSEGAPMPIVPLITGISPGMLMHYAMNIPLRFPWQFTQITTALKAKRTSKRQKSKFLPCLTQASHPLPSTPPTWPMIKT